MSVCVSVNPVCATIQELNLTVLVGSLSVYANYQLSATFAQPIRSRILSVSQFLLVVHSQRDMRQNVFSIFSYSMFRKPQLLIKIKFTALLLFHFIQKKWPFSKTPMRKPQGVNLFLQRHCPSKIFCKCIYLKHKYSI